MRPSASAVRAARAATLLAVVAVAARAAPPEPDTRRISVSAAGAQGDNLSTLPAMTPNARRVAFTSFATNLVPGSSGGFGDVVVRDLRRGTVTLASGGLAGAAADGPVAENNVSISANGRYVAFVSYATNLVPGDTNGLYDVFVRDTQRRTTVRASVGPAGVEATGGASYGPALSANGRWVAFESSTTNLVPGDTNGAYDVFVRDLKRGVTTLVSAGASGGAANERSYGPAISADGRLVVFTSFASDLVPGDTNGVQDVFVRDLRRGTTTRVSVGPAGAQATGGGSDFATISGNGRVVAFFSDATNLVPGDTNGDTDVFLHDLRTGTTTRVSVDSAGAQATGGLSTQPSLSTDGRFVAFWSRATNLVPGDTNGVGDVFLRDTRGGTTIRVSVDSAGGQALGGESVMPSLSGNGSVVAFRSDATNLVPGDTNGLGDVFVRVVR